MWYINHKNGHKVKNYIKILYGHFEFRYLSNIIRLLPIPAHWMLVKTQMVFLAVEADYWRLCSQLFCLIEWDCRLSCCSVGLGQEILGCTVLEKGAKCQTVESSEVRMPAKPCNRPHICLIEMPTLPLFLCLLTSIRKWPEWKGRLKARLWEAR